MRHSNRCTYRKILPRFLLVEKMYEPSVRYSVTRATPLVCDLSPAGQIQHPHLLTGDLDGFLSRDFPDCVIDFFYSMNEDVWPGRRGSAGRTLTNG
jgi:hypothetical protein